MNGTVLPITTPQVYGYLHHAHQLSIVQCDEKKLPWFYCHYLQLYTVEHLTPYTIVDFYSYDGKYPRFPGINDNWYDRAFFANVHSDIVAFVTACIDNGRYVEIIMDEYYLPCKQAYMKDRSPHQNLVYGYDRDKRLFHIYGFNSESQFGSLEITFEQLEQAFYDSERAGVGFFDCTTGLDYSNTRLELDLPVIATYLEDFINSRNSFLTYNPPNAIYGFDTYHMIAQRYREVEYAKIDIRPIHIVHEHKKVMVNRLLYLEQQRVIEAAEDLIEGYRGIEKQIGKLKMMQLKYQFTQDDRTIERIAAGLVECIDQEKPLLERILAKLL